MNALTKYLVESILNDESTENESVFLSKEVIEEWVVSHFPSFISEVSQVLGKIESDDGPNFFFPNNSTFEKISKERAEEIGYTVFKQISDEKFEDYYEHPIYPKGPVKAVTPFPAGVMGKITATNQKDFASSMAYDKWYSHVTRAMALAGYSIVVSKDEIEKRLSTKNAEGSKEIIDQKNKLKESFGLAMGYPSKEDLKKKYKELNRLRRKFDKEREMQEELDKGGEPYVVDLEDLTKDNSNYRTTKWTGIDLQMTLMSIEVGGDIGLEIHDDGDQFLRIESGEGKVVMGKDKDKLEFEAEVGEDFAIFIPQGYYHNIINTGDEPLKLYALYAPPEHQTGKVDIENPVNEDEIKTFKTSLGLDRKELPQIKKQYIREFIHFLEKNEKEVWGEYLNTAELKMTQASINSDLVKELMQSDRNKLQKPIVVSEENYIMDGHHRCVALYNLDENSKIMAIKVGAPIGELLKLGRSFPNAGSKEIDEMAKSDLGAVERYADSKLDPADIEFTKHFFDRVGDPRNIKPISTAELIGFFKRLAGKKKPFIEFLKKYNQFVVTDKRTNINIPFVRRVNQIIAKTIMRKRRFMTSNPKFTVEDIKIPVEIGDTILTGRFKNKKVVVKNIGKDKHEMPTINGKKVVNFRLEKKSKINEASNVGRGYTANSGEPETGYLPDGKKRILGVNKGRPEYWFEQGGYTQLDFPKADSVRGRRKKDRADDISTRKVYYKVQNVKHSTLKPVPKEPEINENMKVFIHNTEHKSLLKNLLKKDKSITLLNKEPLTESYSNIEDMYLTTPKDVLTETVVWETHKILSESGTFPGVEDVPSSLASVVVGDFLKTIVLPTNAIDTKTVVGIGSTRNILQKLPNAKKLSGDLDLLAVSNGDRKGAVGKLVAKAKKMNLNYRVAFGNVFSVAYPYKNKLYQVDLMIAEPSSDNAIYNYMKKFRFWSDEDPVQSTSFLLKGAHRSELTRSIVKAVGLSASESGFSEFVWNDKYDTTTKITDDLRKSALRFKDSDKKNQTQEIANLIDNVLKNINRLKKILADDNGFLKNRYPHSAFRNLPKGYDVLISKVFKKVKGRGNWETVLDNRLGISKAIDKMRKFDDVMNLIKELLSKKLLTPRGVVFAFKEMKKNFDTGKAGMRWNTDLEKYIEAHFPFLRGRW